MYTFIQSTKNFFSKKPVRIILAIIIIAAIMTGVAFGIMAIIKATNPPPKCENGLTFDTNYNQCLENSCANNEKSYCESSDGGNLKNGILNKINFPSCGTCICPDDTGKGKTNQNKCFPNCGKSNEPCENTCAYFNITTQNPTDDNKTCDTTGKYTQCGEEDVYCDSNSNYKCSSDNTYCIKSSPSPPSPPSSVCPSNKYYVCQSNDDCDDSKCDYSFYDSNDWRINKLGLCTSNSNTNNKYNLDCITKDTAKDKLTISDKKIPILCGNGNPCNIYSTDESENTCNGCCAGNVCPGTGNCAGNISGIDYICLNNGELCPNGHQYSNNSKCCDVKAHNDSCLSVCKNKPFTIDKDISCKYDSDCNKLNDELNKAYTNNNGNVQAVCNNNKCVLACGIIGQQGNHQYTCDELANSSYCDVTGACGFETPQPLTETGIVDSNNKVLCYRKDNKSPLYWKKYTGTDKDTYLRDYYTVFEKSSLVNPDIVCKNPNILKDKLKDMHQFDFVGVEGIQYCEPNSTSSDCHNLPKPSIIFSENCDDISEIVNTENFSNIENFGNTEIEWSTGKYPSKQYVSSLWNTHGYYDNSNGNKICAENSGDIYQNMSKCKYLQSGLYCEKSLDGQNCINSNAKQFTQNDLCKINTKTSDENQYFYGNGILCDMPNDTKNSKLYYCNLPSGKNNGFGMDSCCGNGYLEETSSGIDCICSMNSSKQTGYKKCDVYNSTYLLHLNNPSPGVLGIAEHQGNKVKIIGKYDDDVDFNSIILLKSKSNPTLYLNIDTVNEQQYLMLTPDTTNLNMVWRYSTNPTKIPNYGQINTKLGTYDKDGNFVPVLNGIYDSTPTIQSQAIVPSKQYSQTDTRIKPIIVIWLDNNTFVLGATYISYWGGLAMYLDADNTAGKVFFGGIDKDNKIVFDTSLEIEQDDDSFYDIILKNDSIEKFTCDLFLKGKGSWKSGENGFLQHNDSCKSINNLINSQFKLTPNCGNPFTIRNLKEQFITTY